MADAFANDVILCLPMGAGQAFSNYANALGDVAGYGGAAVATLGGKSCGSFNGTSQYLKGTLPAALGTGQWTIEFWTYPVNGGKGDNYGRFIAIGTKTTSGELVITSATSTSTPYILVQRYAAAYADLIWSYAIPNAAWNHIAIQRTASAYQLFVAGSLVITNTIAAGNLTQTGFTIGANSAGLSRLQAGIADFRITTAARYSGNFTPPPMGSLVRFARLLLPPGSVTITGNVIVSGNGGAQQVAIRDVGTRELVATATPNATTGAWTADVPPGDYDISYFAPNCQPVCHGPYTVTA